MTGAQIKALGKRLRDGDYGPPDIKLLEDFRSGFDPILVELSCVIRSGLIATRSSGIVAGRSKRIKSTIRKLRRPDNQGMDLSRMADMAGIRAVVESLSEQDQLVDYARTQLDLKSCRDFRDQNRVYRAVHLIARSDRRFIEVQIRTLPQQLWGNESEAFGEEVKEGGGPEEVRDYLSELSKTCLGLDQGQDALLLAMKSPLAASRSILASRFPLLVDSFRRATASHLTQEADTSYIVVYDNQANRLNKVLEYEPSERDAATEEYRQICARVDESRYETLLLNSDSVDALRVTHPRLFPEPL